LVDLKSTTLVDYPAFRGRDRSGIVRGVRLARNWDQIPPRQLWRQPIGRGWSSFAVVGEYCVTQEQRGEHETVVCYALKTGRECWVHQDLANFYEMTGGGGPRATPTIHNGRVYSLGATGILNCLDGSTGRRIWSVNILKQNQVENRLFGMVGSPLLIDGKVIVSPGAKGNSLVAYDQQDGKKLWGAGDAGASYSAPQLCRLAGRRQILNFNAEGLFAHGLDNGELLWSIPWISHTEERNNVCQPVAHSSDSGNAADRVFLSSAYGQGCALFRLTVPHDRFVVSEQWSNRNLKAKFTSVVVRDGHVYGLDGRILTCLDLQSGKRCWKRGRYGHGQLILVDDLLLIQAESGEVVLVEASPISFQEVARFPALDDRTWNHPALAGNLLVMRNDREAACYELPVLDE
jgi:outer membrane protein assembly factor BamB